MVEEVALGITIAALSHSCQEEIAITVEQLDNPPLITMSPCLSKLLPSVDIQTPQIFRSEDEQLVGHELIEALSISSCLRYPFAPL
jgi:hypothetical protein